MKLALAQGRVELFAGAALAVTGAAFALASARLPFSDDGAPGPGVAPFCIGLILTGLGLFTCWRAVSNGRTEPVEILDRDFLTTLALLVAAIVLFEPLGFLVDTFCFLLISFVVVGREPFARSLAVAFISTVSLWWIFARALGVGLPRGIFPDF
jgi:putative tricarboxylic transport membrane protein